MKLSMGGQQFWDVVVPVLWGKRAVLQDKKGRLTIIDLSGSHAKLEIVGDEPAKGVEFVPRVEGFAVLGSGKELYSYNPSDKLLRSLSLGLPDCQVTATEVRVGSSRISRNTISGFGVGIEVSESGISIGAPLPPNLAKLVI